MHNILVINSSPTGADSVSRRLVDEAVRVLVAEIPDAQTVWRDLAAQPVPHLTTATLGGLGGLPATAEEMATRDLSDRLIAELRAADTVVIGAPMHNFGLPTVLRSWFDHVLRAGETFRYTEAGAEGLLPGKRVIVVESSGGLYSEGPGRESDFQEPYLRQLLAFIGLTDVTFVRAERTGFGPQVRDAAIAGAATALADLASANRPAA